MLLGDRCVALGDVDGVLKPLAVVFNAPPTVPHPQRPPAQQEELGPAVEAALIRALGTEPRSLAQLQGMLGG